MTRIQGGSGRTTVDWRKGVCGMNGMKRLAGWSAVALAVLLVFGGGVNAASNPDLKAALERLRKLKASVGAASTSAVQREREAESTPGEDESGAAAESASGVGGTSAAAREANGGATPSVDEIVRRSNHAAYYQGKDGKARVAMEIHDARGRVRRREFTILRKNMDDKDEEQRFYVYFHRPSDVRKMVFMVHKHVDRDDDRWLYLPALDLVKRIAASDKRTSFVGSHFFYEDVSGRNINEDKHELVETTDRFYVLDNVPLKPDTVEFSHYKIWIDRKTWMPMKAVYFDKNGKEYRVVEALELKEIQGYPTVTKSRVKDLRSGGYTVNTFKKVRYDIGLPDNIFTERYIKRPPSRWLRR